MTSTTAKHYDVIIIGGGPGGSQAGIVLAQAGKKVLILEREEYPRFHIGESLLPATMPLFKETGFYDVLDSGNYIRKYGARFIDYNNDDEVYFGFENGLNAEIPMAFEVERALFDKDILAFAVKHGAELHQPETVLSVEVVPAGAQKFRLSSVVSHQPLVTSQLSRQTWVHSKSVSLLLNKVRLLRFRPSTFLPMTTRIQLQQLRLPTWMRRLTWIVISRLKGSTQRFTR